MGVYSTISVAVLHDCIDEGAGCLVQVPSLGDELREWMLMLLEEEFGERRCALFSAWIVDSDFIERFSERLCSPDFDIRAADALNLLEDFPFSLEQTIPRSLDLIRIYPDTPHGHIDQTWEEIKFEISDRPQTFFAKLNGEVIPEFEGKFSITLRIRSNVHGGHLPHLCFRIDSELPRRFH